MNLSQAQLQRWKVVENVVQGRATVGEAAALLGLSRRQVRRLKRRYQPGPPAWVCHGNQGRRPHNVLPQKLRPAVLKLAAGKYGGFNDSHLHEKLVQEEGLCLSRQSVRRILRAAGIRSPQRRRPPKYRSRRERRPQQGMMLQVDGSRHDWLEGRGPSLTLLGLIDDASGEVPVAQFQLTHEDSAGYLRLFRCLVEQEGIPLAVYRDQHSTFQRNDEHWSLAEQLQGFQFPTQVGRALEELGITAIAAYSPQAKGRIERLWRTFQDRLVSELRLAGARTVEEANAVLARFLPAYNQRFRKSPLRSGSAYRKLDRRLDLDYIFSLRYERTVGQDHVVQTVPGLAIQLPSLPGGRGYAGRKVQVCQQPNGDLCFYLDHRLLHHVPAPPDAPPVRAPRRKRRSSAPRKPPPKIYSYAGRPALALA